jgi:Flp pilus assembly pilin Flp
MKALFRRLVAEERGQDLIEYAFLTTCIALACVAAFNLLEAAIGSTYGSWNSNVNGLWEPPASGS